MQKHIYTEELAPHNTGSVSRPARFNLRLTCRARARTLRVLDDLKLGLEGGEGGAHPVRSDAWEKVALPLLESLIRDMKRSGMTPLQYLGEMRVAERRARANEENGGRQMRLAL